MDLMIDKKGKKIPMKIKIKGKSKTGMPENCKGRCVGISNDDQTIVVGMKGGFCWVISCNKDKENLAWKKVKVLRHAERWISEIKFSPDNSMCAIGDHQQKIWIYQTSGKRAWKKKPKCLKKHSSSITHMDWSACGSYL